MDNSIRKLKDLAIQLDSSILWAIRETADKNKRETLEKAADIVEHQIMELLSTAQ